MELYLVQHGEALPEEKDPERPLTDRGRREVELVARLVVPVVARELEIRHSGKLRAEQTAAILAQHLQPKRGVRAIEGLNPKDDPTVARDALRRENGSLCLVGHLPHLTLLVSLLLAGDPERETIAFRTGGMVCLQREEKQWRLRWSLTPEISPDESR